MDGLLVLSGIFVLLTLLALWRAGNRLRRRCLVSGSLWGLQAVLFLFAFFLVLLLFSNLQTYRQLSDEQQMADIYLRRLGPWRYQLSLAVPGREKDDYYLLEGDQWRLDARVLKWKSWAGLLGLDAHYRLDRLSSSHARAGGARIREAGEHDLSPPPRGLDVWRLQQLLHERLRFADAFYGQSGLIPMADGAHYRVMLGQAGLLVLAQNETARKAVAGRLRQE